MTSRQLYEYSLIELGKINAPALKLHEFNYLSNKAVNQYINTVYTKIYDVNQQATDDLRVLKSTAYLTPPKFNPLNHPTQRGGSSGSILSRTTSSIQSLYGATYEVSLPLDYLHLLNCICVYKVNKTKDCYDAGSYIQIPATRLTADSWGQIVSDVYNRPTPMRPYFYLHNQYSSYVEAGIDRSGLLPQSPIHRVNAAGMPDGLDMTGVYNVTSNGATIYNVATSGLGLIDVYQNTNGNLYALDGDNNWIEGTIANNIFIFTGTAPYIEELTVYGTYNYTIPQGWYMEEASGLVAITPGPYHIHGNTIQFDTFPTPGQRQPFRVITDGALTYNAYRDPIDGLATTTTMEGSNFPRTIKLDFNGDGIPETNVSLVEKPIALRAGNPTPVRMEIRYCKDTSVFELVEVQVDYIKTPQLIRLTQEQIDITEDTSQILEFPDYVCQEILNGLVTLLMLRNNDPKIQSKYGIDAQIQQAILLNQPAGQPAQAQ